jgi:hypothetical protein
MLILKAKILGPQEIKMMPGPRFENKKGFIIDGTIVLNHDRFDSTVWCFGFGHYYARWLSGIIQEHMLLLWRSGTSWRRVFLGTALCTIHRLKHSGN